MNTKELVEFAESFFGGAIETMKKKNADYTGSKDDNPFANFEAVEAFGLNTEIGFLTRMTDKLARIASFIKNGELMVKDESVQDTLLDLANYSMLFAAYLESQRKEKQKNLITAIMNEDDKDGLYDNTKTT